MYVYGTELTLCAALLLVFAYEYGTVTWIDQDFLDEPYEKEHKEEDDEHQPLDQPALQPRRSKRLADKRSATLATLVL